MNLKKFIYKAFILCLLFLLAVSFASAVDMKWKKNDGTYSDAINLNNHNYLFIPKQVTNATCWDTCRGFQTAANEFYEAYVNVFDKDKFILHWAVDDDGKIEIFDLNGNLVASKQKNIFDNDGTMYVEYNLHYFGERYTIWKPTLPSNGVYKMKVTLLTNSGGHESYILVMLCENNVGPYCQANTAYAGKLQLDSKLPLYRKCNSFCTTNTSDVAWCSSANSCVYQGTCYNPNTAYDLNSNTKADAVCNQTTTTAPGSCSYDCCLSSYPTYCPSSKTCAAQTCTNVECGACLSGYTPRNHQLTQTTTTTYSWVDCDSSSGACSACDSATDFGCNGAECFIGNNCCGNNANEFFIRGADGTTACCDAPDKRVVNGICSAAVELCNGIDDDGDGLIDENWPDKGKACSLGVGECKRGGIYVCQDTQNLACNAVPGTPSTEIYDSKDNDCDGTIDEGFDADGDGYASALVGGNDCNDNNAAIHPGAAELCNGMDDDCNTATVDGSGEAIPLNPLQNGVCVGTKQVCSGGWMPDYSRVANYEAVETKFDGLDNDCDGSIDEGFPYGWGFILWGDKFPDFPKQGELQNITKTGSAIKITNDGSYINQKSGIKSLPVYVSGMNKLSASIQTSCFYKGDKITLEIRNQNNDVVASASAVKGVSPDLNLKIEKNISGMNMQEAYVVIYVTDGGICVIRNPILVENSLSEITTTPPTGFTPQYCCPQNKCWNGLRCVDNMQNAGSEWGVFALNYMCINGQWRTDKRQTWDNLREDWCPDVNSCLVNPSGAERNISEYLNDNSAVYSETPSSVNIKCIKSGEYLGDHYCNNGLWETRTRDVALQMLEIAKRDGVEYTLFCDNYQEVLNYFKYSLPNGVIAESYLGGVEVFESGNRFYSCPKADKSQMGCANNFCALIYKGISGGENVIIGTSLNQNLERTETGTYPFLNVVGTSGECSNINPSLDSYQECRSGKIWYNPVRKTILYSGKKIYAWSFPSFANIISNPISSIIRFILNIWAPSPGLEQNYQFIEKRKDFSKLYFFSYPGYSKSIIGFKENYPYFTLKFSGYNSDIVSAVKKKFPDPPISVQYDIDTKKECGNQFVITSAENPMLIWINLTAELRTQQEVAQSTGCSCQTIGGDICTVQETCEKNNVILEFNTLSNEARCCTGGSCVKHCSDVNGNICFDGQTCTGSFDSSVVDSARCCVGGSCMTTQCSAFGTEFTAGSSSTSICNGILKRGYLTTSSPYGSLECCSTTFVPRCSTDSDCLPQNNCNANTCVISSLAITDQVCNGDWGCASSTPTVTCSGWGNCVCNDGQCGAVLCSENCGITRCEGLVWKTNGICSKSGVCQFTSTNCGDENICTDDSCANSSGCTHNFNTVACNDNNPNTQNDVCSNGVCAGTQITCEDNNPCTDNMLQNGVCTYPSNTNPCNDGNLCTENDVCSNSNCAGILKNCPYGCNPTTGECVSCKDSDGLDYTIKGNCTDLVSYPQTSPLIDSCRDTSTIKEAYCNQGACAIQETTCPTGYCVDGSCNWKLLKTQNSQIVQGSFQDLNATLTATTIFPVNNLYFRDSGGAYLKLYTYKTYFTTNTSCERHRLSWLEGGGFVSRCSGANSLCSWATTPSPKLYTIFEDGESRRYNCTCETNGMACNIVEFFPNTEWYYKQAP